MIEASDWRVWSEGRDVVLARTSWLQTQWYVYTLFGDEAMSAWCVVGADCDWRFVRFGDVSAASRKSSASSKTGDGD